MTRELTALGVDINSTQADSNVQEDNSLVHKTQEGNALVQVEESAVPQENSENPKPQEVAQANAQEDNSLVHET